MPDPLNMASSGKKGKKSKGKTLALNDFLQETPGAPPPAVIRKSNTNWADEVEDSYDSYDGGRNAKSSNIVLPTAPKAARGLDDFSDKIPQNPPFNAYLSNLPYDVDESEIADFFCNLKIASMRIPKDTEGSRVKGFGYVEFEDQESLIEALAKPECLLKGRRIRIEVATNSENDRRRAGGRMDMNRDRPDRPEVSTGDWRSGGRKEPEPERRGGGFRDREGGFNRDRGESTFSRDRGESTFSRDRGESTFSRERGESTFSRERGESTFSRERGESTFSRDRGESTFSRDRGESNFGREREPTSDKPGAWRDNTDRPSFRDNDRYSKDDKSMSRDGPPRDRYERDGERRGFGNRRDERNGGGGGGGGGSFARKDDYDKSETRIRPKLNLAPRSKPNENLPVAVEKETENTNIPIKPAGAPAASIFGDAKPVDTTARERQIEERLAKLNTDSTDRDSRKDDDRRKDDRGRRRYSPRRSPDFKRGRTPDRRSSPNRRVDSLDRDRNSPSRRRDSPERRRDSPGRKISPDERRYSPERNRASPDFEKRGSSPDKRNSPDRKNSAERRRISPTYRKTSPDAGRISPDRRGGSPDHKRNSPDRSKGFPHKDEKKGPPKNDKVSNRDKPEREKKPPREFTERDMPKLQTPEPINIVATNKYSFLDRDSD